MSKCQDETISTKLDQFPQAKASDYPRASSKLGSVGISTSNNTFQGNMTRQEDPLVPTASSTETYLYPSRSFGTPSQGARKQSLSHPFSRKNRYKIFLPVLNANSVAGEKSNLPTKDAKVPHFQNTGIGSGASGPGAVINFKLPPVEAPTSSWKARNEFPDKKKEKDWQLVSEIKRRQRGSQSR